MASSPISSYLRQKALKGIIDPSAGATAGTAGMASMSDIGPGVNPGTVFARQRFAQQLDAQSALNAKAQAESALQNQKQEFQDAQKDKSNQARLAEATLKNEFAHDTARQKVGLDVRRAALMKRQGLDATGHALGGSAGARRPYGGIQPGEAIPEEMNGLPLEKVTMHDTGLYAPEYGRSSTGQKDFETAQTEGMKAKSALDLDNIKKTYSQQHAEKEPGILQKMGRFFYNKDASGPQSAGAHAVDYDSMDEDELDQRARQGDQKAFQVGKQKFGKR